MSSAAPLVCSSSGPITQANAQAHFVHAILAGQGYATSCVRCAGGEFSTHWVCTGNSPGLGHFSGDLTAKVGTSSADTSYVFDSPELGRLICDSTGCS